MGLRATILAAVDAAFLAVGDLAIDATYISPKTGPFNITTGKYADTSTSTAIKVIMSDKPTQDNNADGVEITSPGLIIKANDLSEPITSNGKIIISGITYDIKSWDTDPAGAVYDVKISRST